MLLDFVIGMLLAGLTIAIWYYWQTAQEMRLYALTLIIAALIYIGFSLLSKNLFWILIEVIGLMIFSTMAIVGLKWSPWFLVAGWITHPIWDIVLHRQDEAAFVPTWYPIACLSYDCVVAIYITFRIQHLNSLQQMDEQA